MDASASFYDQLREMSKHFALPPRTFKSNMMQNMMLERGLHPEVIVSLERKLDMLIQKERGGFGIIFDEVGNFTADTWKKAGLLPDNIDCPWCAKDPNRPLNLKLSLIGLAVKGQFK